MSAVTYTPLLPILRGKYRIFPLMNCFGCYENQSYLELREAVKAAKLLSAENKRMREGC